MPYRLMVTGHRPRQAYGDYKNDNPRRQAVYARIKEKVEAVREEHPDLELISGMALGADQDFASIAIELGIPFHAYIPFEGQDGVWPAQSKKIYAWMMSKAASIHISCEGGFAGWKMQKRNMDMVDDADEALAIWNGTVRGGTWNCIQYIRKTGLSITVINPQDVTLGGDETDGSD